MKFIGKLLRACVALAVACINLVIAVYTAMDEVDYTDNVTRYFTSAIMTAASIGCAILTILPFRRKTK